MPYDVVAADNAAFGTGAALGLGIRGHDLEMQRLQSEAAYRRLQEQQMAQQMQMQLYQHNQQVDEDAALQKAMKQVQLESQPYFDSSGAEPVRPNINATLAPGATTGLMSMPVPTLRNPMTGEPSTPSTPPPGAISNLNHIPFAQSLMKNVLPVIAQFRPQEVPSFVHNVAMVDQQISGANNPGTIQEMAAPDGTKYYAHVPPPGRGAVTLVGEGQPNIITTPDGHKFLRGKDGTYKPLAAGSDEVANRETNQKLLAEALKTDSSLVDVKQNPDGSLSATVSPENWKQIGQQAQVTQATRTALEKQAMAGVRVFALGNKLADLLQPSTVGFAGNLVRGYEGVMSQLNPDFKIGPATDAATIAQEFQAAIIPTMKSDSNIAEREREQIVNAMPSVKDWSKGVAQAKSTLATVLEQAGTLSRNNALVRGKPITKEWMTPDEIVSDFASGKIKRAEADALRDGNGWLLIQKLRGQVRQ